MELVISERLRKMLEESNSSIAKKILEIKNVEDCPTWTNYLDIAKDDASKISYLTKQRYDQYSNVKKELEVGDYITVVDGSAYYNGDTNEFRGLYGTLVKVVKIYSDYELLKNTDSGSERTVLTGDAVDGSFTCFSFRLRDFETVNSLWNPNYRYLASCGKVVQKLLGQQDSKELAKFCEMFQSYHPDFRFQVDFDTDFVSGEDIRYWYDEKNYHSLSGELSNSCMRYSKCYPWLKLYSDNDDVISMFIVKDKSSGKLVSRCLIWGNKYFDRIYATSSVLKNKVMTYLENLNLVDIYDNEDISVTFDLKKGYESYNSFPYCDTFMYLGHKKISNTSDINYDIKLTNAEGNQKPPMVYCEISNEDVPEDEASYVDEMGGYVHQEYTTWSSYYRRHILSDDAVYCEHEDDYGLSEDVVELYDGNYTFARNAIELGNGKYAHKYDDNLVEVKNGHALKDECVYSDFNEEYILEDDAVYSDELSSWIYSKQMPENVES